jgi:hypothetical protein
MKDIMMKKIIIISKGFECIVNNNNNNNNNENRQVTLLPNPPLPTPSINNNVYVVWEDHSPGNNEVLFTVSNDNGPTFSNSTDNLSNNAGDSDEPQISSSTS